MQDFDCLPDGASAKGGNDIDRQELGRNLAIERQRVIFEWFVFHGNYWLRMAP